jgi:hypothetical protein
LSNKVEASTSFSMTPFWVLVGVYVIALADMPYGYYMITRLITTAVVIWLIWTLYQSGDRGSGLVWILGALAVLYNPVLPIYLHSKPLWTIINAATAAVVWYTLRIGRRLE